MVCPNCGTQVSNGVSFCPQCGGHVDVQEKAESKNGEKNTDFKSMAEAAQAENRKLKKQIKLIAIVLAILALAVVVFVVIKSVMSNETKPQTEETESETPVTPTTPMEEETPIEAETPIEVEIPAPKTVEEAYSLYDKVEHGMKREDIEQMFGEGEPSYDESGDVSHITYFNETKSAGVSIIYEYDDSVKAKTLFFNTKRNLVPFSKRFDKSKILSIKSNMSVSEATEIMGSMPLELSCTYSENGTHNFKKIYCWYNEDASSFMLHTESDIITNVALYNEDKK